jgi:hypothetical protein
MIPQRIPSAHKDSFGFLRTTLVGVTTWTDRQLRNTGVVLPHIAKGDVFSYNVQFNHDKALDTVLDDFHLHIIPISAPAAGQKVAIDYTWGFFKFGEAIPDVLPNSSGASPAIFTFTGTSDQYKHLYFEIIQHMAVSPSETYSSFLLIKCTRRNDAQDTYAGEIALLGADSHYQTNRNGSLNESTD